MEEINKHLSAVQSGSRTKPDKLLLTPKQEKYTAALWTRMAQLFGGLWTSQEGDLLRENGSLSDNALLWARKTEHLDDEAWKRAFETLERRVKESAKVGDTEYPPSYAAFVGYSEKPVGYRAHRPFAAMALPNKTAKEKAKEAGERELARMKSLFD